MRIEVQKIQVEFDAFDFSLEKTSFPKVKDEGKGKVKDEARTQQLKERLRNNIASEGKGADVSRQGVQRDLLPIVEGTTIQTKYGYIKTDHVLFIGAGAFHRNQPSELMPELQGRFPIRVELESLTAKDFERILWSLIIHLQNSIRPY